MGTDYPKSAHPKRGATWLPEELALDRRIPDGPAYRILTHSLGRSADFRHTVTTIGRRFGYSEKQVRRALRELGALGYVSNAQEWSRGRQGMQSDWTFHYPPLDVSENPAQEVGVPGGKGIDDAGKDAGQEPGNPALQVGVPGGTDTSEYPYPGNPVSDSRLRETGFPAGGLTKNEDPTKNEVTQNEETKNDKDTLAPLVARAPAEPASLARTTRKLSYSDDFQLTWDAYGRRGSKSAAWREWQAALQRVDDPVTIMAAVVPYVESTPELKYRKHLERWLRDDMWESAVPAPEKPAAARNGHSLPADSRLRQGSPEVWDGYMREMTDEQLMEMFGYTPEMVPDVRAYLAENSKES